MLDGCVVTLADPTGQIEFECAEKALTQKCVALTYALAMHAEDNGTPVDWRRVNAAIRNRWPRGLDRVKKMAWKLVKVRAAQVSSPEPRKP